MPLPRLLMHLLLVLALLAGTIAPGTVMADASADDLATTGSCHEQASPLSDTADTAPGTCCDSGGCDCSCWHQAPIGVPVAPPSSELPMASVDTPPRDGATPVAGAAPEIRPPIA